MEIGVLGSGGARGWPEPGCRCASCRRTGRQRITRAPSRVSVDGVLRLEGPRVAGLSSAPAEWDEATERELSGYRVRRLRGGWDVTAPDGTRLLAAAGPVTDGTAPAVPPDARYDAALLDLLGYPAQLGWLRARGAVHPGTLVAAAAADHRAFDARELARHCEIWRAALPRDGATLTVPAPGPEAGPAHAAGPAEPCRVLVLGGAGSGKSAEAERRVAAEPAVTYIATGPQASPGDAEWAARIARHRARRPGWWRTAETTDLAGVLGQARGAVLVDSITTWLAAAMDECGAWDATPGPAGLLAGRIAGLVAAWRDATAYVVAVSDETGLGIVPETAAGRLFRDELGRLNQLLAAESDEVIMVVAGRTVFSSG
jgi:adenosylcobinamide kinase/adenosylcobinamide-phosphate guanylyltransferase